MKVLTICIAWMLTVTLTPAFAEEDKQVALITGLTKIEREKRPHWWTPKRGRKVFNYQVDGKEQPFKSYDLLKNVPDLRPYRQKHPVKYKANVFRNACEWLSPIVSIATSGAVSALLSAKKGV